MNRVTAEAFPLLITRNSDLLCCFLLFNVNVLKTKGHWLLNVFPQCDGDLNSLSSVDFSATDGPGLESFSSVSSYPDVGCM